MTSENQFHCTKLYIVSEKEVANGVETWTWLHPHPDHKKNARAQSRKMSPVLQLAIATAYTQFGSQWDKCEDAFFFLAHTKGRREKEGIKCYPLNKKSG